MDSFEDEDSIDLFSDVETVSFANWYRALYGRDQLKDHDMMNELGDDEQENGGPENQTKKKLDKRVIVFELKCPQADCILSFKSLKQLYQHQEAAHGIMVCNCLVSGCSEQYNNRIHLGQHYSAVHARHTKWTCPHCDVIRNNSTGLRTHIRDLHQFGRFGCWYDDCSFEADLRMKVQRHRFKAHPRFICSINGCDKGFYYKSPLKRHIESCHSATCKLSENQVGMIKESDLNLSDSSEPGTSIKVDSKKRSKKESYSKPTKRQKMHVNDHSSFDEATNSKVIVLGAKCPQSECNLMLNSLRDLCQHQQHSHGVLAFPCLVSGCSEQFSNRHKIGHHYSTVHPHHTDWTCPQCHVKKKNATLLGRHIRDYHQFGQFHCAHLVCTFEADLRSKVQNHLKNVHI